MEPNPHRTFHFHACAQAFSANFTRPFHHQIDVQAQSALPITGGHGHARVEDFEFASFISFKRGHSHVSGGYQRDDDTHNTLATSTLEHLNMFDVLSIDRVVSRLYSKHQHDAREGDITFIGSKFENVRVAGLEIKIEIDCDLIRKLINFESSLASLNSDPALQANVGNFVPKDSEFTAEHAHAGGAILCSIIKPLPDFKKICPAIENVGSHGLKVAGFGKVFFGELLVSRGEKSLTMLRFELGSSTSGSGSGGGSRSNGKPWP